MNWRPKLILAILIIFVPCKSFAESNATISDTIVREKAVVFFSITQAEYNSYDEKQKYEIDEVLSDFNFYRDKVDAFLKEHGIRNILIVKPKIIIFYGENASTVYQRKDFDHVVGFIMTDKENKPKLVLGVHTDNGLIDQFCDYFKIEKNVN